MLKFFVFGVVAAVALGGCGNASVEAAKKAVESDLRDPLSVQYRNIEKYDDQVVCGEFNAKNELGGYTGFRTFVYADQVFLDRSASNLAKNYWCRNGENKRLGWLTQGIEDSAKEIAEKQKLIANIGASLGELDKQCDTLDPKDEPGSQLSLDCLFASDKLDALKKARAELAEAKSTNEKLKGDRERIGGASSR